MPPEAGTLLGSCRSRKQGGMGACPAPHQPRNWCRRPQGCPGVSSCLSSMDARQLTSVCICLSGSGLRAQLPCVCSDQSPLSAGRAGETARCCQTACRPRSAPPGARPECGGDVSHLVTPSLAGHTGNDTQHSEPWRLSGSTQGQHSAVHTVGLPWLSKYGNTPTLLGKCLTAPP